MAKTTRSYCSEPMCGRVQRIKRDATFGWWECTVCGSYVECVECGDTMDDEHEAMHAEYEAEVDRSIAEHERAIAADPDTW